MTEVTILPVKMNSSDGLLITRAVGENNTVEEDSWKGGEKLEKQISPRRDFTKICVVPQSSSAHPSTIV